LLLVLDLEPKYLIDYKGLRGDPSDNIIGIKGIGEKTATILIKEYGSIEEIYKILKKTPEALLKIGITKRILNLLKEGEEEALFSKTLATIRLDVPITFQLPKTIWEKEVKTKDVDKFFQKMDFKTLQARFIKLLTGDNENNLIKSEKRDQLEKPKNKEKIIKAQIAFWLLNSEKTNPDIDEVIHYKGSNSLDEAIEILEKDINKENLGYVYKNIEIPIIPIIEKMEKTGVLIDVKYLKKISKEYHFLLSNLEKKIWEISKNEFNVNSPKQLSEILFDKLGLSSKGIKKSAGGALSTRESELEKLRESNPIIGKILEYRELQKLLSTYIDTIPRAIEKDGRLHANFVQTGTTTGRFASNNPNLQNIPTKTEKGKNIRKAFIAPKGSVLVSFDYSQIELRVAALMCQDPYFIKCLMKGKIFIRLLL